MLTFSDDPMCSVGSNFPEVWRVSKINLNLEMCLSEIKLINATTAYPLKEDESLPNFSVWEDSKTQNSLKTTLKDNFYKA